MFVKDMMKTEVITLQAEAKISEAYQLLQENHIRHIPIIDNNKQVIGIISDRDVRDASPSILDEVYNEEALSFPVSSIMTTPVTTIHPYDYVEEIAAIFYDREFACLPVVKNNILVGIITEKDMLYTLIQLTGTHVPSSQIEIKVPDRIGVLADVSAFFKRRKIKVASVLIYPYLEDSNYKILVFRIQTMNPMNIMDDFKDSEFEIVSPSLENPHE
ncbi:CBS and ACT domain-containing protein [Saliterribacillus persicus]|uniref:Acetoin utilization protein AcuB n=1 Tax=Saliterribacillus persicus TaxID=930114 RepID=A0A368X3P8_9BACI|nr:CBS and ACT domain-containing protein [Saliterribacillus persicus]RCW62652.1 acetoin utilization protein AcuB [Saliterribacillus persicus]